MNSMGPNLGLLLNGSMVRRVLDSRRTGEQPGMHLSRMPVTRGLKTSDRAHLRKRSSAGL
jgi:hypothetical protein